MSEKRPIWTVTLSNEATSSPPTATSSPFMNIPSRKFLSIESKETETGVDAAESSLRSSWVAMRVGLVMERTATVKSATEANTSRTTMEMAIVEKVEWYLISLKIIR